MAVGTPLRSTAPAAGAAAPPVGLRRRFSAQYWAGIRFLLFGRTVPAALFGFMGWLQLTKLIANVHHLPAGASASRIGGSIVSPALYTMFCAIPVMLYLTRPRPRAHDGRLVARGAAFSGTLMQLVVGAFIGSGPLLLTLPRFVGTASVVVSIVAFSGAIWSLAYLRRNLSIIPEARRLATGGPYRLVRHPLYFFEITAAVAVLSSYLGVISCISFVGFVLMQMTRARFEERLLAGTFPDYADYARRTRRLIPFVW
jgi:protein-S-isoprenylcysteine O-methyltransferase Ste14